MLLPKVFDNMFASSDWDDMFRFPFLNSSLGNYAQMHSDIKELDNSYIVEMDLPGFSKDDVHADLKDGYLTIHAEKTENKEEKDEKGRYLRRERYSGSCQRSFFVGREVTQEEIQASFKDGILKLEIPKKEQIEQKDDRKYIEIKG